jgi:UDP-N-acetylmuramoylalanine--D-glutamate ligase
MKISELKSKKIIIFGYGREGQATLVALRSRGVVDIVVTDEQIIEVTEFVVPEKIVVDEQTVVIKAPGIPLSNKFVEKWRGEGAVITSSTNIFLAERKGRGKLIGITGTKGKSTTAALLAHVLGIADMPVKLVGNIGVSAISEIDAKDETVFVLEMSSYQLADLDVAPDIGVILNLYEEHMDWHGGVDQYQQAKLRLGEVMTAADVLVYNKRFARLAVLAQGVKAVVVPFELYDDEVVRSLTLLGEHNKENACAVLTVARMMKVDDGVTAKAFASFVPLPHRLQEVGKIGEVLFVNDSISTTPESALAAIEVYADKPLTIILGGQDRGYNFTGLAKRLGEIENALALVMPGGERVFTALAEAGVAAEKVATLSEAVEKSLVHLVDGGVCLLSPASPSYGQFKNFEERGQMFTEAVEKSKLNLL